MYELFIAICMYEENGKICKRAVFICEYVFIITFYCARHENSLIKKEMKKKINSAAAQKE